MVTRYLPLVVVAGLVAALNIAVWRLTPSQPPIPSGGERNSSDPNQESGPNQRQPDILIGTESAPPVIRITKSPIDTKQEEADRKSEATTQRWTVGLTGVIALFTGGLIVVGWLQRQTYQAALATTKATERAYVEPWMMPPGIVFTNFGDHVGAEIHMRVKNRGRTPAKITNAGVALNLHVRTDQFQTCPIYPERGPDRTVSAFLVTDGSILTSDAMTLSMADYIEVTRSGGTRTLNAVGYIDYIDRFGNRHRAGVGVAYAPELELMARTNKGHPAEYNVATIPHSKYNYDRERKRGEGNDWDEDA